MNKLNLIAILILLASCVTEKKAKKYFDSNERLAAKYCDAKFPNIVLKDPELKPGKTIRDTIYVPEILTGTVDCPPGTVTTKVKWKDSIKVKEIKSHTTDTLKVEVENGKKVRALETDNIYLRQENSKLQSQLEKARKTGWTLFFLLLACLIYIFRKVIRRVLAI